MFDAAHPRDGAFDAHAEAGVGDGAEAAEVEIPPVVVGFESLLGHSLGEDIRALFTLAAADDLADAGHEQVHRGDGLAAGCAAVVLAHVERLDRAGIVVDGDGTLEMLLGQIAFVLGL